MSVKTSIIIEPSYQIGWDAKINETSQKRFIIRSNVEPGIELIKVEPRRSEFSATYTKLPAEQCKGASCYELSITFQPRTVVSRYTERIAITTTSKREPTTYLTIFGRVDGNIVYEPHKLNLQSQASRNFGQASATVHLNKLEGGLEIVDVTTDNPALKAFLSPLEAGKSYVLTVVWGGEKIDGKRVRGNIMIKTNDPLQAELSIPYSVHYRQ